MVTTQGTTSRRAIAVATGIGLAVTGVVLLPSPSQARGAAPTATYTSVYGAPVTVVSTKHRRLSLSTSISKSGEGTNLYVSVALPNRRESHSWAFSLPSSALRLNAGGSGTAKTTSAKLGGLGTLSLKIAGSGATKKSTCQGQLVSASRHATVSGKLLLDTKSAWGKVGSARKIKFAKASTVYWSYPNTASCPAPAPTCSAYSSWSMYLSKATGYTSMSGYTTGRTTSVTAYRSTHLRKPAGASRTDFLTQSGAKAPRLTVHADDTATMQAYAGKGSATLTASAPGSSYSEACGHGTQSLAHKYWSASVHQGSPAAKLTAQVFGAITLPNSAGASISQVRVTG